MTDTPVVRASRRTFVANNIVELREAAHALEDAIAAAKDRINEDVPDDVSPYVFQFPTGEMILAPMLAAQITILQQIDRLTSG